MNDFDLESELYAAMADETERLGPPALDLDRVRRVARRRRMALTGSGAATALAGVAVAAVAVGGFGGPSGAHESPVNQVPASSRTPVAPDTSGCDQILLLLVPSQFTGKHKPPTPPTAPTPLLTRSSCRTLIELPPYQRTSPHVTYSGIPLLPPSGPSPTPDGR